MSRRFSIAALSPTIWVPKNRLIGDGYSRSPLGLKLRQRLQPSASSNCRSSPVAPAPCRLSRRHRKHIACTLRSSPRSRASGARSAPSCLFPAPSFVISIWWEMTPAPTINEDDGAISEWGNCKRLFRRGTVARNQSSMLVRVLVSSMSVRCETRRVNPGLTLWSPWFVGITGIGAKDSHANAEAKACGKPERARSRA